MNAPFRVCLFVCTGGKTCPGQGGIEVHAALKEAVFAAGLGGEVRVNKSGCFAQCGYGPMVVVEPAHRWYAGVRPEDAAEILEAEVRRGAAVERLLHRPPGPGKNVRAPDAP